MGIFDFLFKKNLANYELKYKEAERKYFQNDYKSAIADLRGLIAEYPHYQCYGLLGSCYFGLKKFDEALPYYKKSIEKEPSFAKNSMAHDRIDEIRKILIRQKEAVNIAPKKGQDISDIQGNSYKTIILGEQTWFGENLNVSKFKNGDEIPEAVTMEEWDTAGQEGNPAWCYFNNDPKNGEIYGKLYNWHAVNDPRGLAPKGTHVPNIEEWNTLVGLLGENAAQHLKSTKGWHESSNGTNKSMMNFLPGGYRCHQYVSLVKSGNNLGGNEEFLSIGKLCSFQCVSKHSYEDSVWGVVLYGSDPISLDGRDKKHGTYVRCIVDK